MENEKIEPKWMKQDLQRWKDNAFTKHFFKIIQEEVVNGEKALVNMCVNNTDINLIRLLGGQILSLRKILDVDCQTLGIGEVENE